MTDIEKLIARVMEESGKTIGDIEAEMKKRKEKTHGLLSDYGALYAVAKEYGVDLSDGESDFTALSELAPSKSVNVCGRIKTIFSEREFSRKDGSTGRFASLVIADASGESRVVLWDSNTSLVAESRVGDVLAVKNGYVKENRGNIELHAGSLTAITLNPPHAPQDLPEVKERIDILSALEPGLPAVNVICRISSYYPKTEFSRADGSTGSRASFMAEDETGKVRVVLWDPLSETELAEGDIVKIENAYTKEGLNGGVELQAGSRSRIGKTEAKLNLPPLPEKTEGSVKISDIKSPLNGFTLEARVLRVYEPREYSRGTMASLILGDSTGTIRCVLWNEASPMADKLKEGDAIRISNAYSKANMNSEFEVHVGKYAKLDIEKGLDVPSTDQINEVMAEEKSIMDLDSSDSYVKIKGKVIAVEERSLFYMTCGECNKKVQNLGGEWMCEECGVVEGSPNMLVSVVVEDKTGNIRAVAFKNNAEKIIGMDVEAAMNMIGETQDEAAPLSHAKDTIVGQDLTLLGRVNYNDYSDQLEFLVNDVA